MFKRCQLENDDPPPHANVRVEDKKVMGCVECTVCVYIRMPPDRGGWGVPRGSLCRIEARPPLDRHDCCAAP